MARPGWPERNKAARSFRQLRRFLHVINSDKVFGTHKRATLSSICFWRRWILPCVKLLSRLFTALNLLPSTATLAFASRPILRHNSTNRAQTFLMAGAVVFAEIGDGFVIRYEPSRQPHHFQIAAGLTLQPPARLDSVEIAVDVELEHRRRMIRGPAGRCRIDAIEPEVAEFQRIDEHIDRANRIALADPIIEALRPIANEPNQVEHPPSQ